jgi:uncharacterized membrane protein
MQQAPRSSGPQEDGETRAATWSSPPRRGTARPERDLALVAVAVGVGALWAWSRRPRRRDAVKRRPDMPTLAGGRGLHVERTLTVQRTPDDLYQAWRDLERLPRLLPGDLVSVTASEPGRSHWVVAGPAGVRLAWDAELTADEPGRLLAWRSAPGADVDIAGSVRFSPAPGERGTEMKVILTYAPPGGKVGATAAALLGRGGDRLLREALRRFKHLMETGEIAVGARSRAADDRPHATGPRAARSAKP